MTRRTESPSPAAMAELQQRRLQSKIIELECSVELLAQLVLKRHYGVTSMTDAEHAALAKLAEGNNG